VRPSGFDSSGRTAAECDTSAPNRIAGPCASLPKEPLEAATKVSTRSSSTPDENQGIVSTEANLGRPSKGDFESMARRRFQDPRPQRRGKWWTIQVRRDDFVAGQLERRKTRVRIAPATVSEQVTCPIFCTSRFDSLHHSQRLWARVDSWAVGWAISQRPVACSRVTSGVLACCTPPATARSESAPPSASKRSLHSSTRPATFH